MGGQCSIALACALALACSGCIESGLSVCANGRVCGPGLTCNDETDSCLAPQQMQPPVCGDGIVAKTEECDDGGWLSHDGCDSQCKLEAPVWRLLDSTTANRRDHAMAYDAYTGRVVMFGGFTGSSVLVADTREWDGTQWVSVSSSSSMVPSARSAPAMAYDVKNRSVLLFGGSTATPTALGDTWSWNGFAWTQRMPVGLKPSPRRDTALAADHHDNTVLLYGGSVVSGSNFVPTGETWVWDGSYWTQRTAGNAPGALGGETLVPFKDGPIMFGGTHSTGETNELWSWGEVAWNPITPATGPDPRSSHAMAYLPKERAVLFGGSQNQTTTLDDTWVYDNGAWTQLAGAHPPGRYGAAMVYDAVDRYVLLAGGYSTANGYQSDTWAFRYEAPGSVEETCNLNEDADGDGLMACDDPDCWPYCFPDCPPGTGCPVGIPVCGDLNCDPLEEGRCPDCL